MRGCRLGQKTLNEHRRVIFNGNGYSEAWEVEAERRGLPNRKCTPDAMIALKDAKNIALMEEFGVLTKTEMLSRYEVEMEHYSKILNIEARTMLKIANKQLIPAATAYMGEVAGAAAAKTAAVEGISTKAETKVLTALSKYTDEMSDATDALQAATDKVSAMDDEAAKAHAFHDEVIPRWMPCVPPPTRPRASSMRITGPCPATAVCCSIPSDFLPRFL